MSREIYNSVLRKLAVEVPLFAETILDKALEKVGATPDDATPFQLKTAIEKYVEPALKEKLHVRKGLRELGMGTIVLDKKGKVKFVSHSAKKLIPDIEKHKFLAGDEISSEKINIKGNSINILKIPHATQATDSHDSLCIVSDVTLDKELDKEMQDTYSQLLNQNTELQNLQQKQQVTEEALKSSEERYKIVTKETGQLIYDYDLTSGKIIWAGAIEEVTGYKPDSFKLNIDEWGGCIHPDDRDEAFKLLDKAQRSKKKYVTEYRFKIKGGKYKYIVDSGIFFYDRKGKAYRMLGAMADVTFHKLREINIQKSEENYRTIFNSVSDAIFLHDIKTGQILDVNKTMTEMYGYTKPEALNLNVGQISEGCPPYSQKEAVEKVRAAAQGIPQKFEWRCKKKDGTLFWAEVQLKKVNISDQDIILAVVADIQDQKDAEKELHDSEEKLRDLFDNVEDLIQSVDAEGNFVYVNKTWKKVLGYTEKELQKMKFTDVIKKDHIHICMDLFKKVMKGHPLNDINVTFITKSGKEVSLQGNSNAFFQDGKFVHSRSIFRDVSSELKAEEELLRRNEELERFNKLAVGRELKMIELKKRINELEGRTEIKGSDIKGGKK